MTKKILIIAVIVSVCCTACRLVGVTVTYNMTGGSLDPAIKTFSVDYFPNKAPLVMPTLSTTFTEKLTEYIRQKTGLTQLTDNNGDIRFEGQIVEYSQRPMDITSGEIATSNRLTIGIRVKYTNMLDDKFDFSSTFSHYADYSTDVDFNSVEESLIDEILDDIIEDIYNKAIVNW